MRQLYMPLGFIVSFVLLVSSESYYSIIAPGVIKSNHKFMVVISLHEATEPATIKIHIEGPFYYSEHNAYLQPYETTAVVFILPKLAHGEHKLVAEGISGIQFRNESIIYAHPWAGPKIYIQTDKAIYKPGDKVQFRAVILDEHTRPLKISEPIRVDVMDGNANRVKQFKDIQLVQGIYKNHFQLSEYPVMGKWQIRVYISGKYDFSTSKTIKVQHYVLPKFSVYIKSDGYLVAEDRVLKALVFGKYTFDKYVEGNVTAQLVDLDKQIIQQKQFHIKDMHPIEFHFDNPEVLKSLSTFKLEVNITEKHTGLMHSESRYISICHQRYRIYVQTDSIEYQGGRPYRLTAKVEHWNRAMIVDRSEPVIMTHGTKEYSAYLDSKGEARFEFDHEPYANHIFRFRDSTFTLPNIFRDETVNNNKTESYCKLKLKTNRPRLGNPVEIEVTSIGNIPYFVYTIVSHANIIHTDHITLSPNQKSYTIKITPSIEMIPQAYVYVHYVLNGNFHYKEIRVQFPMEFENKVAVMAPKQVKPGQNVTLELKAQPKSYVGVLAVDLGVYLLDSSYDLQKWDILSDLHIDTTITPLRALVYPGLLSGLVTFTNAHYEFVPLNKYSASSPNSFSSLIFRKKFPETWIFENYEITNGSTTFSLNIPDTITTWRITAFSINEITGFGIVDGPTDITTIQPFFINLNLPYSVKRGEIVSIPVLIHNYHDQDLDSEIIMYNQDREFYFMESTIFDTEKGSEDHERVKRIKVPANGVEYAKFLINPKEVGEISLKIVAKNAMSSDAIIQKLKVEPEGIKKRQTNSEYISVTSGQDFKMTLPVNIPLDIVPNSEFVTLSVGGDSLVPTIKNLNSLVLLPTGCGEQNMVNFAPNILVLQYLKASGKYFTERSLVRKAKSYIEIGYQQQLSYRHTNGGYSVFGQRKDAEPSTWLTAYVLRFFIKGSNYFAIESNIIGSGLEYLVQTQLNDGSFPYTGYLFYPAQQNRYGFTAFVLMTFLEDKKYSMKYESCIQKSLKFLNGNLDKVDDIYALSIMAAALQMAKHANAQKVIDKLMLSKNLKSDIIWFSQNDGNREKDVEITAYALMALLQRNDNPADDLRILKWLTEQRNEHGGFKSTHDTVVGLQALVKFSEKYNDVENLNLKIQYTAKNNEGGVLKSGEVTVDKNNQLILQTEEFPKATRSLEVQATGTGHSLVQLSYHYHVLADANLKHFHIQPKPKMLNNKEMLLETCFTYQQSDEQLNGVATNMIIMEANLPSGFTSNDEFSSELLENEIVERIESKNDETTLVIYFEKLSTNVTHCLNILASKMHDVIVPKPAAIALYDYYNISRHDTAFYSV